MGQAPAMWEVLKNLTRVMIIITEVARAHKAVRLS